MPDGAVKKFEVPLSSYLASACFSEMRPVSSRCRAQSPLGHDTNVLVCFKCKGLLRSCGVVDANKVGRTGYLSWIEIGRLSWRIEGIVENSILMVIE